MINLMFEEEEKKYRETLERYNQIISNKMDKTDLALRNEVLISAHSCGIEGNSYSVSDSFALKELELGYVPKGKSLVETMEILDHFHAYEYILQTKDEPLTEQYIKHVHFLLTEHTINYRYPDTKPGEYTNTDMGAGDTIFGDHETLIKRLPDLLEKTNKTINEGRLTPIFISAIFHGYFIYLHPFRDGNGRLGRLLSNKILLQAGLPPLIIKKEDKADYINVMNKFKKENGSSNLVSYFYHTAIKQMESEIEEKQRLNEGNNFKDFN